METPDVKKAIDEGLKGLEERVTNAIVAKVEEKAKKAPNGVKGPTQ